MKTTIDCGTSPRSSAAGRSFDAEAFDGAARNKRLPKDIGPFASWR